MTWSDAIQPFLGGIRHPAYCQYQIMHRDPSEQTELLVDTHVHTHYSDGLAGVPRIERFCRDRGLGVAVTDPAIPLNARELLQVADDALYRSKNHGRNRSELGTPPDPTGKRPPDAAAVPAQSASK